MKRISLVLFAFLLLASQAHADGGLNFSGSGCQGSNDLLNTLLNLPSCIVDTFFSYIVSGLIASVQGFVDASFNFLFSSPNPLWFCTQYNTIMSILETLFSIALMGVAMMFIVRSNDVEGRIAAKKWLENMLIMIVLLSFSFMIFQTLLDFNTYLATSFANQSMKQLFTPSGTFNSVIFALIMLFFITTMLVLTFVTLLVRYIMIPFLLLAFPIAIFLYFIPLTQSWGRAFLKAIAMIVFMTSIDALVLLGLSALFSSNDPNLTDSMVRAFAILFGFSILGVINVFLILSAALSVVSQSKALSGVIGFTVLSKVLRK